MSRLWSHGPIPISCDRVIRRDASVNLVQEGAVQRVLSHAASVVETPFWWTLSVCALWAAAYDPPRILTRRQSFTNLLYTPYCKFDEDIIQNDKKLENVIRKSDYAFSGKVVSDVQFYETNKTISFSVLVKRFFKSSESLKNIHEIKVIKKLHDGEGTECRQMVRYRYIGIFVGEKPKQHLDADVLLTINPITITLQNLDRVNNVVKKGQNIYIFTNL
ncbi:hypothetical protein FQR65_LT07981 [Abscondita terminalis]|nr:hypothetical protein FQR65_LT07981 [Abscondita terminalis]